MDARCLPATKWRSHPLLPKQEMALEVTATLSSDKHCASYLIQMCRPLLSSPALSCQPSSDLRAQEEMRNGACASSSTRLDLGDSPGCNIDRILASIISSGANTVVGTPRFRLKALEMVYNLCHSSPHGVREIEAGSRTGASTDNDVMLASDSAKPLDLFFPVTSTYIRPNLTAPFL
jgi:hypothetical protein